MLELKRYQQDALEALDLFLDDAREHPAPEAFARAMVRQEIVNQPYDAKGLEAPYLCLRLPTGGGKTLLASHAIPRIASRYLSDDAPVVLWLVPTKGIHAQTLDALKNPAHPYREALDQAFQGRVAIFDLSEVTRIRPSDLATKACVIVGTLASIRVEDTEGRKIYAHHEAFEDHLKSVAPKEGFERDEQGRLKYSFANVLNHHRPIVILDELHKAGTKLSFETLKRVHPAFVLGLTATPKAGSGSNVLFHVSASALKAEDMIKLPLMLTAHKGWQEAVRDALLTREKLAEDAKAESAYLRPLALFQAQDKNGEVTVEVLKKELMDQGVPESAIAIATGSIRELDGVDLFDPACPITCILTIEALKEGWDCSFAYVFCSVAKVRSKTDVEQLLGRVLRMPYAKRRAKEALNRAYAHVSATEFYDAATALKDCLVDMGFEALEAEAFLQSPWVPEPDGGYGKPSRSTALPLDLTLDETPDLSALPPEERQAVKVEATAEGVKVSVQGEVSEALGMALVAAAGASKKAQVSHAVKQHQARVAVLKAPALQGVPFGPLARLCGMVQGELALADAETFLTAGQADLLDQPYDLTPENLRASGDSEAYALDMEGKKVSIGYAADELGLDRVNLGWNEHGLLAWLLRESRNGEVPPAKQLEFIRRQVTALKERGAGLATLVRHRFQLARLIGGKIAAFQSGARARGFEAMLFEKDAHPMADFERGFTFDPAVYPASALYSGAFKFKKHYYPTIHDLKAQGEEFACARALEAMPEVKHWVRNIPRQPMSSFWLPTSSDRFYPDFIAELVDGRILVVEYKGEPYKTNDDSKEKASVGALWERLSGGRHLFLMAVEADAQGRNAAEQIKAKVAGS